MLKGNMDLWFLVVCCFAAVAFAGKDTDEELAHYIKKEPTTDMPWTSNEMRINKMIEETIIKFNYAHETTESPFDSQGKPRPTESKNPIWWNAYRQEKDGDRPDWSAEIRDLIRNPRTSPPWTPSQESEAGLSKWKDISPFTWKPGVKINWTRRTTTTTIEPPVERSITVMSAQWDTSEDDEGGGTKEPPLNLAPLKEGYKNDDEYLKVKPRRKPSKLSLKNNEDKLKKMSGGKVLPRVNKDQAKVSFNRGKGSNDERRQRELRLRQERKRRLRKNTVNVFARV